MIDWWSKQTFNRVGTMYEAASVIGLCVGIYILAKKKNKHV